EGALDRAGHVLAQRDVAATAACARRAGHARGHPRSTGAPRELHDHARSTAAMNACDAPPLDVGIEPRVVLPHVIDASAVPILGQRVHRLRGRTMGTNWTV